jgi:N-acetylmuramoyl-L-alanine amidase
MPLPQTILLAAGHGGKDTGALSPAGHTERDQAIAIVDIMADKLRAAGRTVIVAPHQLDTHETIPWLNERYQYGDVWALEIHRDSADTIQEPAASLRCGIYHGSSPLSRTVAGYWRQSVIQHGAHASSWERDQKTSRHGRLGWIAQPKALSHLLELGFMQGNNSPEHIYTLAGMAARAVQAVLCSPLR